MIKLAQAATHGARSRLRALGDRAAQGRGHDSGAVTILFAVGLLAVMMIIGLSVDVSGVLRTRERARAIAEQAARYGAEQISTGAVLDGDGTGLATGNPAERALTNLVCHSGWLPPDATCVGDAVPGPNSVTVTIAVSYDSWLNRAIPGDYMPASEQATAIALLIPLDPPATP